jgi:spore coat polysaccharide biosynthesis protein SpsF
VKIFAIIQARMGSTRLPGKVLLDLAGEPVLARVVQRSSRAATLDEVIVATTTKAEDQPIIDLCIEHGWRYHRGSEFDLLDRYYQTVCKEPPDIVARITSDCPLIDPEIIDRVVGEFLADGALDYAGECCYPVGLSIEVMTFAALERAWLEDRNPLWREHVTPYIYRHPELFRVRRIRNDEDLSGFRWTLDTPEDFKLISRIYDHFGHDRFSWKEALVLAMAHPEWTAINANVNQKTID